MDIVTLIGLCALLTILWESGIIPAVIAVCVIILLWKYYVIQIVLMIALMGTALGIIGKHLLQQERYKKETPEERKQREDLEKIREWSRRNKC